MAQTILYYPSIDIQDSAWLRNALLYWDSIASIVPYENYPNLSPELLYLQEKDIYKPFLPQTLFGSDYASEFTHTVIARLERYRKRAETSKHAPINYSTSRIHRKRIYAPALHELLHYRKVSPELIGFLTNSNLIYDYYGDGWMEIDAHIAAIYMRTFAEFAVKCMSEDAVIGTDQAKHQNKFYTPSKQSKNTTCLSLALDSCLPQPAMNVGFEELLDFKNNHKNEFAEFRKKLREFEKVLSLCTEVEAIKFETEKFKEDWQSILLKENKMFLTPKIPFTLGTLYTLINVPAVAEPLANFIENIIPFQQSKSIYSGILLGGTAAITLGCKYVNYRSRINEQRSSAGFSYIIEASRSGIISQI